MRLIDADRLLTDRMKSKYYHLPNGDIAIPIIDIEHAPTVQPDPDTVSRQAVIELIQGSICDLEYSDENRELCDKVRALPPSPSRPHGHWKFVHPLQEDDPCAYICSECGTGDWKIDPTEDRFCKFCGSDNREDGEKGAPLRCAPEDQ